MPINFLGLVSQDGKLIKLKILPSSVASPSDGQLWYDAGSVKFKQSGSNYSFDSLGETNTASSAGGTQSLVLAKSGVNLPFKGLTAGSGISLTPSGTDITIASTGGGGGEANTTSSAGGTVSFVKPKVGVDLPFRGLTGTNGVTFTPGANDITIAASSSGFTGTTHPVIIGNGAHTNVASSNAESVAIGKNAMKQFAFTNSHSGNSAVGYHAMRITIYGNPVSNNTAVGAFAAEVDMVGDTVAIGYFAGQTNARGVCIGDSASVTNSTFASNDVCIGYRSGAGTKDGLAVCIGYKAAETTCNTQAIVINAQTTTLDTTTNNGVYIAPIRAAVGTYVMKYTSGTFRTTYDTGKTFVLDHPTKKDKYLVHECVEGPEMLVYYRGKGEIYDTHDSIKLPEYCRSWNYFTVDVSPIGISNPDMYASEVNDNMFNVYGSPGKFSWTVYASRGEIQVEVDKKDISIKGDGPYTYME